MNKRANETVNYELVLVIASILVFTIIIIFVNKAATTTLYYEEVYAKKIGLSIEASSPGTVLEFDISKPYDISKVNKFFKENFEGSFRDKFFYFDNLDATVRVKLSDSGGFDFKLMSNKTVKSSRVNIDSNSKMLIVEVGSIK